MEEDPIHHHRGEQPGGRLEVREGRLLEAGLELLRRPDFNPELGISVHFAGEHQFHGSSDLRRFFRFLLQSIQTSSLFKGPEGDKAVRRELIMRAFKAMTSPIEEQTIFEKE